MNDKIAIIYLGKKGGGALLALQIAAELDQFGISFLSEFNEEIENYQDVYRKMVLKIPFTRLSLLTFKDVRKVLETIKEVCMKEKIEKIVFVMPHLWDFYISRSLSRCGFLCSHIIHDFPKHPFELFPPNFFSKLLMQSSFRIICLSKFVAEQIPKKYKTKVRLIDFPKYNKVAFLKVSNINTSNKVLVIGRRSKYKNIKVGLLALTNSNFNGTLVIAGEIARKVQFDKELELVNYWLQRKELENLISQAEILLLPYSSATQSGIIPIAMYHLKKIVVTDVGGLGEQVKNYRAGFVSSTCTVLDISNTLNNAIDTRILLSEENLLETYDNKWSITLRATFD